MSKSFTFIIEKDAENGKYIGTIPSVKGAYTYADTIDDFKNKLAEVLSLCLEEMSLEEKLNSETIYAINEADDICNNPELHKQYASSEDIMNEVLNEI